MKRIQRKRTKGYKQPENCKYVGRGTKWGNPFKLEGDMIFINAEYRRFILDPWVYYDLGDIYDVVALYRSLITKTMIPKSRDEQNWVNHFSTLDIEELRGYDYLSCFCNTLKPCHANVLIQELTINKK